ncbi:unnamed protein product [Microthlaspi erraticum]|uniref:RNase H type-1 domain-containing protein n=1 Tax=Microthlaspi erraticum TaxID=1685480 RepID=A0A6D2JWN2_9BRAS|nr:unnamed protein product [Microthlaspi erraticum]
MGWTFHDSNHLLLQQNAKAQRFIASPLVAEALAIRLALQNALDLGFTCLHVASDSNQTISAINSGIYLSEAYSVLQDISHLASRFHLVMFVFVPRDANVLADSIAKLSLRNLISDE